MELPAVCDKCNIIFPSGFSGTINTSEFVSFGNTSRCPDPMCRGLGRVIDGTFSFLEESIEVLSAPEVTKDLLRELGILFERFKNNEISREKLEVEVNKKSPIFKNLLSLLPKDHNLTVGIINLMLTATTVISNMTSEPVTPEIVIQETYNIENYHHYENVDNLNDVEASINKPFIKQSDIGRNDPCHCGSGKKFKKCHGF